MSRGVNKGRHEGQEALGRGDSRCRNKLALLRSVRKKPLWEGQSEPGVGERTVPGSELPGKPAESSWALQSDASGRYSEWKDTAGPRGRRGQQDDKVCFEKLSLDCPKEDRSGSKSRSEGSDLGPCQVRVSTLQGKPAGPDGMGQDARYGSSS